MKSSWVTILQGVEFSIFPLNLAWALQQCSATALPVITVIVIVIDLIIINYLNNSNIRTNVCGLTYTLGRDVNGTTNVMKIVLKPFHLAASDDSVHSVLVSEAGSTTTN